MGAPILATFNQFPGGRFSTLNLTAGTLIKATPGVIYRFVVNAPGTTSGAYSLYDANALVTANTITGITAAAQAVVSYSTVATSNPFAVGNTIVVTSAGGMTQINGVVGTVTAVGGTSGAYTATTSINSSAFSAWTSGGTAASYGAGNLIWEIAYNATANVEGAMFTLDWPCANGILLATVPGGGSPIASASWF